MIRINSKQGLAVAVVLAASACGGDVGTQFSPRVKPGLVSSISATRLIDPPDNPTSPNAYNVKASVNWSPKVPYGISSVTVTGSASGGTGGPYYYVYAVDICDIYDYCSGAQELAEGYQMTSWTYSPIPSYAAYVRVTVQAKESHDANYLTGMSSTGFVRGPAWAQYGGQGTAWGVCGGSMRYNEFVPDASWQHFGPDSVQVVDPIGHEHEYRRNWCTGKKELQDSLLHF